MKKFNFESDLTPKIQEYLPQFLSRRFEDLDQLGEFLDTEDFDGIRAICHRIYGVAGPYGMPELGLLAKSLSGFAKNSDVNSSQVILVDMRKYLLEAEVQINKLQS